MTSHLPDRFMGPRRIAVLSVGRVDRDPGGSASALALEKFDHVVDEVVFVDRARGDAAVAEAFAGLSQRLDDGELSPDDLVVTLGASGADGHDPALLDDLQRLAVKERLDALLVRRDRSGSPPWSRAGGTALSLWASLWAGGVRFHDVATDHRIFRLAPLVDALDHCADAGSPRPAELAVVLGRMGARVRNEVLLAVPPSARPHRLVDRLTDAVTVPIAAFRAERGRQNRTATDPAPQGQTGSASASSAWLRVALRLAWPVAVTATLLLAGPVYLARWARRRRRTAHP